MAAFVTHGATASEPSRVAPCMTSATVVPELDTPVHAYGDAAAAAGVSVGTLRKYLNRGLLGAHDQKQIKGIAGQLRDSAAWNEPKHGGYDRDRFHWGQPVGRALAATTVFNLISAKLIKIFQIRVDAGPDLWQSL